MKSIIGKKIGMTSVFDAAGKQTAVTIIEAGPCVVTQKKTVDPVDLERRPDGGDVRLNE